ncbi:MAG: LysE family transporter [Helicobacter sp.]|nr:LysE family transporter [Helicobacter sp.]
MRVAFVAFLGIASGWVVFMGALYLGLSYVLGNVFVQIALMFVGGVYLAYLAYVLLVNVDYEGAITQINQRPQDKDFRALLGLYFKALGINLSNPKALLFFCHDYCFFYGGRFEGAYYGAFLCIEFAIFGCDCARKCA